MKYRLHEENRSGRTLKIVLLGGLAVVGLLVFGIATMPTPTSQIHPVPAAIYTPKPRPIHASLPVRLKIPQIKVDAAIEYLGLTTSGEMATTKDPATVAWYELGQRPGDTGSAVIAGHFGWKNNLPAAFDHLTNLQKGDMIYVEDKKGGATTFAVQGVRVYGKNDDTKSVFSSNDGKSHLNLITCEGTWSNASHSYSNRLVVFSDRQ